MGPQVRKTDRRRDERPLKVGDFACLGAGTHVSFHWQGSDVGSHVMRDVTETQLHRVSHHHQRMGLYVFGLQQLDAWSIPSAVTRPVSMSSSGEVERKVGKEYCIPQAVIAQ